MQSVLVIRVRQKSQSQFFKMFNRDGSHSQTRMIRRASEE